jgi:hypothetical protein
MVEQSSNIIMLAENTISVTILLLASLSIHSEQALGL